MNSLLKTLEPFIDFIYQNILITLIISVIFIILLILSFVVRYHDKQRVNKNPVISLGRALCDCRKVLIADSIMNNVNIQNKLEPLVREMTGEDTWAKRKSLEKQIFKILEM